MRNLSDFKDKGDGSPAIEGTVPLKISVTNIDDVLFFARREGITDLHLTPDEFRIAIYYYLYNTSNNDPDRSYILREGKISKLLGVNLHG